MLHRMYRSDVLHLLSVLTLFLPVRCFFFFNVTATAEIYTLSLHDALPIFDPKPGLQYSAASEAYIIPDLVVEDRKSTRLNSSHGSISYAVFCLKKKRTAGRTARGAADASRVTHPQCSAFALCAADSRRQPP